jgi:hypothetical protein
VAVALHSVSPATRTYVLDFWADGFPPAGGSLFDRALWLGHATREVFSLTLGYPLATACAAMAALGAVILIRRSHDALILVGPILATVGAAMAHQYPFHSRVVLFLAPALICFLAAAIESARAHVASKPALGAIIVAAACLPPLSTVRLLGPVFGREDVRPLLARVRGSWRQGDVLYVYYGAWQAAEFYGPRYGFTRRDVRAGRVPSERSRGLQR